MLIQHCDFAFTKTRFTAAVLLIGFFIGNNAHAQATPPSAPTGLTATVQTDTTMVLLSWTNPTNFGTTDGSTATTVVGGYQIDSSTDGTTFVRVTARASGVAGIDGTPGGTSTYTATITAGAGIYYRVVAVSLGLAGPVSNVAAVNGPLPPSAITDLSAMVSASDGMMVLFSWTNPTSFGTFADGSPMTDLPYLLQGSVDGRLWADVMGAGTSGADSASVSSMPGGASTHTFAVLPPGMVGQVRHLRLSVSGVLSNTVVINPPVLMVSEVNRVPPIVFDLGDTATQTHDITSAFSGGGTLTYTAVKSTTATDDAVATFSISGSDLSITPVTPVKLGTITIDVTATSNSRSVTHGFPVVVRPRPAGAVTAVASQDSRIVTLSWEAPTVLSSNGIKWYSIGYSLDNGAFIPYSGQFAGPTESVNFDRTTASRLIAIGTPVYLRVRAIGDDNTPSSGWTLAVSVMLGVASEGTVGPGSPTGLTAMVDATDPTMVTLDWTAPSNLGGVPATSAAPTISGYTLQARTGAAGTFTAIRPAHSGTPTTHIATIVPNAHTFFRVRATNSAAQLGAFSSVVAVNQPPPPPAVATDDIADLNRSILPEVARAIVGQVNAAVTHRIAARADGGAPPTRFNLGGAATLASLTTGHAKALADGSRDAKSLLAGADFALSVGEVSSGQLQSAAVWGSSDYRRLSAPDGSIDWDGEQLSLQLGADARFDNLLAGAALAWSETDIAYTAPFGNGDYALTMLSAHPYLSWRAGAQDWWASAGYGQGELSITQQGSAAHLSDVQLTSIGLGTSGEVLRDGDTRLRVKGEIGQTRLQVTDNSPDMNIDVSLVRVALQASDRRDLGNGAIFEPSVELGARYDAGDGADGGGLELDIGLRRFGNGVIIAAGVRTLVASSGYQEYGAHAELRVERRGLDGQGLSISLRPGYGNASNQVQTLWNATPQNSSPANGTPRLSARLEYGIAHHRHGLLTPYTALTTGATERYRLGLRWQPAPKLDIDLSGERQHSGLGQQVIMLEGRVWF